MFPKNISLHPNLKLFDDKRPSEWLKSDLAESKATPNPHTHYIQYNYTAPTPTPTRNSSPTPESRTSAPISKTSTFTSRTLYYSTTPTTTPARCAKFS